MREGITLTARPPWARIRDITDDILAREVVVCAGILLLGARYDPADLRSPKGRQDCCAHRVLRHRVLREIKIVKSRAAAIGRPKRSVAIFRDGVHGQRR
ncbi:hypothetical protein XH98_19730 [Bradyrhizobium sp. CCBAU 51745]|nr:hypothetical protein [Bradyrhizobium sp. CCBAU 45384]MDA9441283.1 hypothetical protein [Bradyrhizobium sp. CCBAU 51745]